MAHRKLDRVAGTTTSAGAGALTLDATAVEGYSRFQDVMNDGDTADIMVVDRTTKVRQGGKYTYNAGAFTLTTLYSSTTGSQINFGAGTKDLFDYAPAEKVMLTEVADVAKFGVVTVYTANEDLTPEQSFQTFANTGAIDPVTLTLPSPSIGLEYTFVAATAEALTIEADGSSIIALGEVSTAAGGAISSSSLYSVVTLKALSATLWVATSMVGNWSLA